MYDLDAATESIARAILAEQQQYLAEQKGYSDEGFRSPACFHGVSQWTDYDAMCGACEDGAVNEYSTVAEVLVEARDRAEARMRREKSRRDLDHMIALITQDYLGAGLITPQQASAGMR